MSRTVRLTALAAVFTLVLAACGNDGGDTTTTSAPPADETTTTEPQATEFELITPGTLTVCTETPFYPMEFVDESHPTGYNGFDIELSVAIAEELGLDIVVSDIPFDLITAGVAFDSNDCDMGAASITIRADRAEVIDFSEPYFLSEQSLLVSDSSGITSLEETVGHEIAVQTGTTGHYFAEDEGPEGIIIVEYPDADSPWLALEGGQVDGFMSDLVATQAWSSARSGFTVVETFLPEEYGLATKDSPNLLAAINAALAKFRSDGTYQQIFDAWFLPE